MSKALDWAVSLELLFLGLAVYVIAKILHWFDR
jgi:hypothetical protein